MWVVFLPPQLPQTAYEAHHSLGRILLSQTQSHKSRRRRCSEGNKHVHIRAQRMCTFSIHLLWKRLPSARPRWGDKRRSVGGSIKEDGNYQLRPQRKDVLQFAKIGFYCGEWRGIIIDFELSVCIFSRHCKSFPVVSITARKSNTTFAYKCKWFLD